MTRHFVTLWVFWFMVALVGCAAPEPVQVPVEVKVPVKQYVRCEARMPDEPLWATKLANPNADIWDQSKVLRVEVMQHEMYEVELKKALEVCIQDPATPSVTNQSKGATP